MPPGTPRPHSSVRRSAPLLLLVAALFLVAALPSAGDGEAAGPNQVFAPTEEQRDDTRELVRRLERVHYLGLALDDTLSERIFDNYIDFLDGGRSVLLASDLAEFEAWRTGLDEALNYGDLDPAFTMFNRYHERQLARLAWVVTLLEGDLSELPIGTGEELEVDREDAPWAETQEELDTFWRKRLASQIIGLELAGSTREEAQERLLERQREQLRRAGQYQGRDVFQFFMAALTDAYDPHTQFMLPRLADNFDMAMSLSFEGIGALLRPDGEYAMVERIIVAGPAEKDGRLQAGDRIVGVGQGKEGPVVDIIGWRLDDAVELIRGEGGSTVRLSVRAADSPDGAPPKVIDIVRDRVKLEEQSARSALYQVDASSTVTLIEGSEYGGGTDEAPHDPLPELTGADGRVLRIGVVDLPTFYMDTEAANRGDPDYKSTTRDVRRLLEQMTEDGVDGVILDLRGNGGGSLTEAYELSGLLLGNKPAVQVREAGDKVQVLRGRGEPAWAGPLVVLVDRLSASASEIVAAAVQDHRRGLVLGERTFGKGTVQAVTRAGNGRLLVTIAKFYRVTGESTQHAGVTPDIELPATYDPDEIGESSMEGALEWDVIDSLKLRGRPADEALIPAAIPQLRANSLARAATDPDLDRLTRELALLREVRADTSISLDLETRRAEQEDYDTRRQEILASWREAKGYPDPAPEDMDEEELDRLAQSRVLEPAPEPVPEDEAAGDASGAATDTAPTDEVVDVELIEGDDDRPATPRRADAWLQEAARVLADLIVLTEEV